MSRAARDAPAPAAPVAAPHERPAADVVAALASHAERGLDDEEAARRLAAGANVLPEATRPGLLRLLAEQFRDPLVLVLLGAALVSGVALGEWLDAGVILAIVALDAALGTVQHARAQDALAALRRYAAPDAEVVRAGQRRRVPAAELVLGDVVVLGAGDRVPADGRVLEAYRLVVDESVLTGESVPADKQAAPADAGAPLADRDSMVYLGTTVAAGRGTCAVTATGVRTEMGSIARLVAAGAPPPTPLQRELAGVGRRLALLAGGVAAAVFGLGLARRQPAEEMFLTAVALAVAAIPEALPAAVTITLARGVQRLARARALVRRLPAVETLGAATVICTDKTGTLTRNELRVVADLPPGAATTPAFALVVSLCTDAPTTGGTVGDPVEHALLAAVRGAGADPAALRRAYPRLDEVPFDSARKAMTTLHADGAAVLLATKGAPEIVVPRVEALEGPGGPVPLDEAGRADWLARAGELAASGLRTLALAYRRLPARPPELEAAEAGLVLVGVVGLLDDLREEAPGAVAEARAAGIRVVMITGDHAATAETLARRLDIVGGPAEILDGRALARLDRDGLAARVEDVGAYARVDPADKVKIVDAWHDRGAVVAMTGDGVNDAPALRRADIGIAMGSGTDVGKDASDIVLADDNFATIVAAIREGRRVFHNLRNLVHFLVAANAAEVFVVAAALVLFAGLGAPLLPTQILWINLVTDGLPVLALAVDPAPAGVMARPPILDRSLLARRAQLALAGRGAVLAAVTLAALATAHVVRDLPPARVRTLVFTTLVLVQLGYVFAVRRGSGAAGRPARNPFLVWSVAAAAALQVAVVHTPPGQALFRTVALDPVDWLVAAGATIASFAVVGGVRRRGQAGTIGSGGPPTPAHRPGVDRDAVP